MDDAQQYLVTEEPYYRQIADEVELFEAASKAQMPMMLKGPTGCGKSRFVEYMAWKQGRPLVTVACNEDMTASDLVGRFLLDKDGTRWQDGPLALPPLPCQVLEARTLEDKPVAFTQSEDGLSVSVAESNRDNPVTVIELTLDAVIAPKTFIPALSSVPDDMSEYGEVISDAATLALSSVSVHDRETDHAHLFTGEPSPHGYAFCTDSEERPWVKIDLGAVKTVKAALIENKKGEHATNGLTLFVSEDGENWDKAWEAAEWEPTWCAPITRFHAGIDVPGRPARYLMLQTQGQKPRSLLLQRVTVYGSKP